MHFDTPFAFTSRIIPRHKNVLRFDWDTFAGEFLCYLGKKFFQFGSVDDGDTVHD